MLKTGELSEDAVIQILLCLPVISLLRFKGVCKAWYALITHRNFAHKHLLHNKNKSSLLLVHRRDRTTHDYLVSCLSYKTLQVYLSGPLPSPYFEIDKKVDIFIAGSCNGLVCLCDNYDLNTVMWNPATKETKVVPRSNVPRFPAGHIVRTTGLGFGYDVETNDYKIIRLPELHDPDTHSYYEDDCTYQTEVYSLSTNSWRKVDNNPIPCYIVDGWKGNRAYTKGMASWWAKGDDWEAILSFDMSNEVFLRTSLPDESVIGDEYHSWRSFFVLNELVALAVHVKEEEPFGLDIWLLHEYGVKESWTKLFTIGPLTGTIRPLGFRKNDTIFLDKSDGELVLYDFSTKETINLPIGHAVPLSLQLITYEETLTSVQGGSEFVQGNS